MAFHQRTFRQRYEVLGDIAEPIFEAWATERGTLFERFGQHRPKLTRHWRMDPHVRLRPDYQCEDKSGPGYFVEVKGCKLLRKKGDSENENVKIKQVTLDALLTWRPYGEVFFFIYDSGYKQYAYLSLEEMIEKCKTAPIKKFENDNNEYYALTESDFVWKPIDGEEIRNKGEINGS